MIRSPEQVLKPIRDFLCIPAVYLCISILLIANFIASNVFADYDLFARLAVGRLITNLGQLPLQDPFAFTARKAIWIDHEWLSGLVFYQLWDMFGDAGLMCFKLAIMSASVVFLCRAQKLLYPKPTIALIFWSLVLLTHASFLWSSTIRCQVFTYFFLSFYLYAFVFDYVKKSARYLWLLPPVMALWCNLHGGFVVGLGLTFLYAVVKTFTSKKTAWAAWLVVLFSVAATAINPYGPLLYWSFVAEAITMSRPSISEWNAITPSSITNLLAYLVLAVTLATLVMKRRSLLAVVFILVSAYFGFRHVRLLPIFCFCAFVFTPDSWQVLLEKLSQRLGDFKEKVSLSFSFVLAGAALIAIFNLAKVTSQLGSFQLNQSSYPQAALDWLKEYKKNGKLLVDFNNGSFALWKLYPNFLISLDGRYEELYPETTVALVSDALNCVSRSQSQSLLTVGADYILVDNSLPCWSIEKAEELKLIKIYDDSHYQIYTAKLL